MKIQLDLKSIILGLALGAGAMFTMADSTNPGYAGRYQVSTGYNSVSVIDTATGEVWLHPATTDGQGGDRIARFWEPKN